MIELIEVLCIFMRYGGKPDFHCEHDVFMYYGLDEEAIERMNPEDLKRLDECGFFISDEHGEKHFESFRYGSC